MKNPLTVIHTKPSSHFGSFSNKCTKCKKSHLKSDTITYLFSFNGHELDNEVKEISNYISFGDYGYDPNLARRWRPDPQMNKFPSWSPYFFSFNNPILFADRNGEIPIIEIDEQSKTIMIYQPVFLVTKGPGAISVEQIHNLQDDFNQNIITSHLEAISNSTGIKYNIVIQFQLFEGGTFEDAQLKNKEATKMLGMSVHGSYSSFDSDEDFEQKYKDLGGLENPRDVGGFTASNANIYIRGSRSTWRERIHEGLHLSFADDADDAVGIMKYTNGYGIGPGVNLQNINEVLNKSILNNPGGILRFNSKGTMQQGDISGETFDVKNKPDPLKTGRGSGMGSLELDKNENLPGID